MDSSSSSWSEAVEDLVEAGETDKAISLLESVIGTLENSSSSDSDAKLASALTELAKLYSSNGFSLKSDELHSRASLIQHRVQIHLSSSHAKIEKDLDGVVDTQSDNPLCSNNDGSSSGGKIVKAVGDPLSVHDSSDDDWEAIADRSPEKLISPECLPGISELSMEDTKLQDIKRGEGPKSIEAPKRRGRGTFSYRGEELYSDRVPDGPSSSVTLIEPVPDVHNNGSTDIKHSRYGTRHVLVLDGFSPSTRTTDLEKIFTDFRDRGVVIRWVNDTVALAVFRTPSVALEASKRIQRPFTVRVLDADDNLINSIPARDLEPPRQRPATSARTAKRLIAHGMGIKLPSEFGSKELRQQEEARKNRILSRQHLKEDAWGAE